MWLVYLCASGGREKGREGEREGEGRRGAGEGGKVFWSRGHFLIILVSSASNMSPERGSANKC